MAAVTLFTQIIFPIPPPTHCSARIIIGDMLNNSAVSYCIAANSIFDMVLLPEINAPRYL